MAFGKRCKEMGLRPSTGTVGDAHDNAMAESFFATLECELIDRRSWGTHTVSRLAIFTWIEASVITRTGVIQVLDKYHLLTLKGSMFKRKKMQKHTTQPALLVTHRLHNPRHQLTASVKSIRLKIPKRSRAF